MPSHIIQRQIIEVTTERTVDGFEFKEQLAELCKIKLLPAIEQLFDSKATEHKILQCGNLVIDAGELPFENWETLLIDRVIDELTKRISSAVPLPIESEVHAAGEENVFQEIREDENKSRSILYFLENGSLPWSSLIKSGEVLHNWMMKLIESSQFLDRLLKLIKTNPDIIERLIQQFDLQASEKIIVKSGIDENFIQAIKDFWRPILRSINVVESNQSKIIY
ncbi:MAG TPA: contractile injection system tape measure protein, partial [Cyclobacteriaceae bacterium]|nr:contractile injection system tape measure protein [Cyclobacteriaceae bacterium]